MANDENLKQGKATQFGNSLAAREAQKKSAASRKRNNTLRKLGQQMLQTSIDISHMPDGAQVLAGIRAMGFDTDEPELQMLILARLGSLAISVVPEVALAATKLLMEITGNDVRSLIAADQRKVDYARLKLEREKFDAMYKAGDEEALRKLDQLLEGIDAAAKEAAHAAEP